MADGPTTAVRGSLVRCRAQFRALLDPIGSALSGLELPRVEALLLLPMLPGSLTVPTDWEDAARCWGVEPVELPQAAGLPPRALITGTQNDVLMHRPSAALLTGTVRRGSLIRAGYDVRRWELRRTALGPWAFVPADDQALAAVLRAGGSVRHPRQVAADGLRRVRRPQSVTVASQVGLMPLALSNAAVAPGASIALLVSGVPRRRPVFLITEHGGVPERVVKIEPGTGTPRGPAEQLMLRRLAQLGLGGSVPAALGEGRTGTLQWTAESAVAGRPLPDVLAGLRAEQGRRLLDQVAALLTVLAVRSRGSSSGRAVDRLRGPHRAAAAFLSGLRDVPGVVVHGDLATGGNILVDRQDIRIIDWETAQPGGLPLLDLLPLLCTGIARLRHADGPDAEARVMLALCRGEDPDSAWLYAHVRRALAAVDVPLVHAGALAMIAFATWASMPVVHAELVLAEGGTPATWRSAADVVASAWVQAPDLGARWTALTREDC